MPHEFLEERPARVPETYRLVATGGGAEFGGRGGRRRFFEAGDFGEVGVRGGWSKGDGFNYVTVAEEGGFGFT